MKEDELKFCADCGAVAWFYIWNFEDDEEIYLCFDCLCRYVKELAQDEPESD